MHCWAQYLFIALVAVLGIGGAVTACGQKGDLYLPERSGEEAVPQAPSAAVPAAPLPADGAGRG